jgi:hypothetical protein
MPDQFEQYYKYLKTNGADVAPDFNSFKNTLSNYDNASKYYSYLKDNQFDVPATYDSFADTFGLKKKDQGVSLSVSSPTQSLSPDFEKGKAFAEKGFLMKGEGTKEQKRMSFEPSLFGGAPNVKVLEEGENPSILADFTSSAIKGQIQGKVANILSAGKRPTNEELGQIAQLQSDLQLFPQSKSEKAFQEKGLKALFKETPLLGVQFIAETMASSLSSLFEASQRTVPTAVAMGAAAGAPFAGIGALVGAGTGLLAGQSAAGYNISTSQDILSSLSENGVDISDKESLINAFSDEAKMAKIRNTAAKYGIPILVFDAATAGLAGKLAAGAIGKSLSKKLLAGVGETGIQIIGGSGGELAAQINSGKKVNWDEIAIEGFAEIPGGVTEVATGVAIERAKSSSNNKTLATQIATQGGENGSEDAIINLNRDLSNNVITPEQYQEGISFVEKAFQVWDKIPETVIGESRVKSIELLVERNDIKQANQNLLQQKQTADEAYHAGIDEEIKANEEKIKKIDSEVYNIAKNPLKEVGTKKYIVDGEEISQESFEGLQDKPIGTKEIISAEVKPTKEIFDVLPYVVEDREKVEPIIDKINNGQIVNEEDLYNAAQVLENLQSKTDNESLKNLINPVIDKILTYENQSKTAIGTVTEKGAITRVGTDVRKKTVSKALGQFEGSTATITDRDGKTVKGYLKSEEGTYNLYDKKGNQIASIGEKQITDRDVVLPSKDVVPNPITLDKNGNIKSITLQLQKVNEEIGVLPDRLITIDFQDAEKALDYAIQLRAEQVGEFSDPEFEEIISQVEKEIPISKTKKDESIQDKEQPRKQLVQAADQRAEQKRKEEFERDVAKREEVKETLINLRNEGVLVTADKSILGKLKKAIGIKQAPMTDAEIDAQMSLLDAMAKVWKQTTSLDNFYDTFIADIKKGDVKAFRNKGGVLFQKTENPISPISRVTFAMFEVMPQFQKMKGQMVNTQSIADLIKSNGKQIEKDIINDVLSFEKYKGVKKIYFDEFRNDVETQIMKLEKIRTDSYASYGRDNLGDNVSYGSTETILFNAPINHGETGHFGGDFINAQVEKRNWELKQIPGTDTWVAMDKDMPSGISQDQIQNYVGTAGTQESVQKWINERAVSAGPVNRGMFGHIRNWFNKNTGIWTIAELQSDIFQKFKADALLANEIPKEEIDEYMNKEFWSKFNKEYTDKLVKDLNLQIIPLEDIINLQMKNSQETSRYEKALEIVKNTREFNQITKELERLDIISRGLNNIKNTYATNSGIAIFDKQGNYIDNILFNEYPKPGMSRGEHETYQVINNAAKKIADNFNASIYGNLNVRKTNGDLIDFENKEQLEEYVKYMYGKNPKEYFAEMEKFYKEKEKEYSNERKKYIQKRIDDQTEYFSSMERQFIASQKFHEIRLLREAFKNAAEEGAEVVRFPAPYTIAIIEGYTSKVGEDNMPYEIISGNSDRLDYGDVISMDGNRYYVLDSNPNTITVSPQDSTYSWDVDEYKSSERDNRVSEITYEAKKHFANMDNITLEEIESFEADEWMASYAKDLLKEKFEERAEFIAEEVSEEDTQEVTISWNDIESKLDDKVYDEYDRMGIDELFDGYGDVYSDGYGNDVLVVESRGQVETLNQPNEYDEGTNEDDFEKELNEKIKKLTEKEEKLRKEGNTRQADEVFKEKKGYNGQKTVIEKYRSLNGVVQKLREDARFVRDDNNMEWIETNITDEDRQNPIIAFQQEGGNIKGAIDFINDNKASVYVFDGADISTLAHEFTGHLGRRFLEKLAESNEAFAKDYESIKKWAGVKDNTWSTRAEEKFARAFERYLREGKAPTKALSAVFENLKKWLTQIYNTIKGSSIDVELTQEVKDVFGGLLGAKAEGTLAEQYENIPKEGKLSTKNAVKTLINDNFEEIKKQLENKKICQ